MTINVTAKQNEVKTKFTYKNGFYRENAGRDKILTCLNAPKIYKGVTIYHRIASRNRSGNCFDVVIDNICVGMYAGQKGAENFIDECIKLYPFDLIKAAKEINPYLTNL